MLTKGTRFAWVGVLLAVGCSPTRYQTDDFVSQRLPTSGVVLESALRVSADTDVVWQRLVGGLAASPLFITQIDRSSRLITVEFSAPSPSDYLDCGTASGEYVERNDTTETQLRLADGGRIVWGVQDRMHTGVEIESRGTLNHTAHLTGGMNIYVMPVAGGSEVRANARYLLRIDQHGAQVAGRARSDLGFSEVYSFTTHGQEEYRTASPVIATLRCTPTGMLERQVLEMAR